MENILKSTFFRSNKTKYRMLRTIAQGIIGVIIANLDLLVSGLTIPPEYKAMIVAMVMAVLSPIMSELGKAEEEAEEDETDYVCESGYPDYFMIDEEDPKKPAQIDAADLDEEEAE